MEENVIQKPDEVVVSAQEVFSEVSLFEHQQETSENDLPDYGCVGCHH